MERRGRLVCVRGSIAATVSLLVLSTAMFIGVPGALAAPSIGHIKGTIRDSEGHPVSGASIVVRPQTPLWWYPAYLATTKADGSYEVTVAPGHWVPEATGRDYRGTVHPRYVWVAPGTTSRGVDLVVRAKPMAFAGSVMTSGPTQPVSRELGGEAVRVVGDRLTWISSRPGPDGRPATWLMTRRVGDSSESTVTTLTPAETDSMSMDSSFTYDVNSTAAFFSTWDGITRIDLATGKRTVMSRGWSNDEAFAVNDRWLCFSRSGSSWYGRMYVRDLLTNKEWSYNWGPREIAFSRGSLSGNSLAVSRLDYARGTTSVTFQVFDLVKRGTKRGTIGPVGRGANWDQTAKLVGDRVCFVHGDREVAAATLAKPTPVILASTVRGRFVGDLVGDAGGLMWTDGTDTDTLVRSWEDSGGAVATVATSTAGSFDLSGDRLAWAGAFDRSAQWSSAGPVETRLFSEASSTRADGGTLVLSDQRSPRLGGGKLFWLDDRAIPYPSGSDYYYYGASGVYDLYEMSTIGGPESIVATGIVGPEYGSMSGWSQDSVSGRYAVYAKSEGVPLYYQSYLRGSVWVYDSESHESTLIAQGRVPTRSTTGLIVAQPVIGGDWVYYTAIVYGGRTYRQDLMAYHVTDGERRTVVRGMSAWYNQTPRVSSNGMVTYSLWSGLRTYDPATRSTTVTAIPKGIGPFPPYYPAALFASGAYDSPDALTAGMGPGFAYYYNGSFGSQIGPFSPVNLSFMPNGRTAVLDPAVGGDSGSLVIHGTWAMVGTMAMDLRTGIYYDLMRTGSGPVTATVSPSVSGDGADIRGAEVALAMPSSAGTSRVRVGDLTPLVWDPTTRIAGMDRFSTAVALSQDMTSAPAVVIANGRATADAMVGGPLAHALHSPILFVETHSVPASVTAEISRLGSTRAVILGGTAAVGSDVASSLAGQGLSVERLGGIDRYETSALVALAVRDSLPASDVPAAFVASGLEPAGALAAGPVASVLGEPIVLTTPGKLPETVSKALVSMGTSSTVVVGGSASVSDVVMAQLPSPTRLAGLDRYDTARVVAEYGLAHGMNLAEAVVSNAVDEAGSLAAGGYAARRRVPLLLVNGGVDTLPDTTASLLRYHRAEIDQDLHRRGRGQHLAAPTGARSVDHPTVSVTPTD